MSNQKPEVIKKSNIIVCHGQASHPVGSPCFLCKKVDKEYKQAVKKAGGKKKFVKSLKI